MSFFDRVGDFFEGVAHASPGDTNHAILSTIGSAWSAADNSFVTDGLVNVDKNLGKYTGAQAIADATTSTVGKAGDALNAAYSYVLARPISTGAQMVGNSDSGFLSPSSWQQAFDRSATISPGQAVTTDLEKGLGQVPGLDASSNPDFANAPDPFDPKYAADRRAYFDHSWAGKLDSGAIDLFLNIANPAGDVAKIAKGVEETRNVVKLGDRAGVLERAVNPAADVTARQAKQGDKLAKAVQIVKNTPTGALVKSPLLDKGADANAYANLFQQAKDLHPMDSPEQTQAIANVFGTMWGDQGSMDRLVQQRDGLAEEMKALSSAPAITANSLKDATTDLPAQQIAARASIDARMSDINDEIDRINLGLNGAKLAQPRVAGDIRGNMSFDRFQAQINESYIHAGSASVPVRAVGWANAQSVGRVPMNIDLKDAGVGHGQLTRVLAQMSGTTADYKNGFLTAYTNALTPNDRLNVVKDLNKKIVLDAGRKYGMTDAQIDKHIKGGEDVLGAIRNTMQTNLYSAAEEDGHMGYYDPEMNEYHSYDIPFAQTLLEDNHPVLDPRAADRAFKEVTKSGFLQESNPALAKTLKVTGQVSDAALKVTTRIWKDATLVRPAYTLRLMTDTLGRLGVHMDMAQFLMSEKQGFKGVGKYLLSDKDGETKSLKNLFKEGDMKSALAGVLKQHYEGVDSIFQPTDEDVERLASKWSDGSGSLPDFADDMSTSVLRRYRNGKWDVKTPKSDDWAEDYLRVVNQQIMGSPAQMEFVAGKSIDQVAADVRKQQVAGGPLAKEYQNVGKNFKRIEDWLTLAKNNVDHYLPHPDMREKLLPPSSVALHRIDDSRVSLDPTKKPHGVYYSVNRKGADFTNPFDEDVRTDPDIKDVKETTGHSLNLKSDKVLKPAQIQISLKGLRGSSAFPVDADSGVSALRHLLGKHAFESVVKDARQGKAAFIPQMQRLYPDVDWDKYHDPYEMLMAYGALKARDRGYQAIHIAGSEGDDLEEYVALTKGAVLPAKPERKLGMSPWDVKHFMVDGQETKNAEGKRIKNLDPIVKPMNVHGEMYSVEQQSKLTAGYNAIRSRFFRIAAEMPETIMGRAPLYHYAYGNAIKNQLAALPEKYVTLDSTTAIRRAADRQARKDMGRILYDAADASNAAHTMRYLSPFFTAWEDTMKKWGGLMYDNPGVLTRINQLSQAPNDAHMVVDSNGNEVDSDGTTWDSDGHKITDPKYQGNGQYVVLPKALTKYTPLRLVSEGGKGQIKIRKDSIDSVFQGQPFWLPGFGPAVQVPAAHIVRQHFPKEADDPIMKFLIPYGTTSESVPQQLLPKWASTLANTGMFGTTTQQNEQNEIFLAEAVIDRRNQGLSGPPDLDAIHRKTRNYFIMKALTDSSSPVSFVPNPKYQLYIDKAHAYRADPTRTDWLADFTKDFPGYSEMAISLSANNTGLYASTAAYDGAKKYKKQIEQDPANAWLFLGPANNAADPFNGGVYDYQSTNEAGQGKNFRSKQDPQIALQNFQAEQGWTKWNNFNTAISLQLKQRGLVSTSQKGAEDLDFAKKAFQAQLSQDNKAWADAKASASSGGAGRLIDTAQAFIASNKNVATRPDMVALQKYVAFRAEVKTALEQRTNTSLQYNPDLQYALNAFGASLSADNVGFEAMWNRHLQYDDLSDLTFDPATGKVVSK